MFTFLLVIFSFVSSNLYSSTDELIFLNSQNFDEFVLNSNSPILVEFYANWCGHCKNLVPELTKAASSLKGVGRIGVVDSDQNGGLLQKYNVKGFPTLLFFADGKHSEYKGQRTAAGIVDEYMRFLSQHVKSKLGGKKGSTNNEKKSDGGSVIELSESSFDELVLHGNDSWFVEFYAPWCQHCQNLAPIWREVAMKLDGKVKVGAVDATKNENLARRFNIQGFPTLKFFYPGTSNSEGVPYEGSRNVDDMVSWVEQKLESNAPPVQLTELTSQEIWNDMCGKKSLCIISFLPHLLDCDSACRVNYQNMLQKISDSSRSVLYGWLWAEGGVQKELENALEIGGFGYPAMAIISRTRMRFGILKGTFDENGINDFLGLVIMGKVSTSSISAESLENIKSTDPWDGKDAPPIVLDDIDLSDL